MTSNVLSALNISTDQPRRKTLMTISHRPHILKMRTKTLKILKHEPSSLCLSTCRQLKLHHRSAQPETLLLVLSVVDFVFLQKLCVFLPKYFCLLLKTVGPGQQHQHRRHIQIHILGLQKPKQFVGVWQMWNGMFHRSGEIRFLLWLHSPGPLFGFIVNFPNDSIFLIHEVVVNFFQFSKRVKSPVHL